MNVSWFSLATNIITVALFALAVASIARMIAQMDRQSGYLAAFGGSVIILGGTLASLNNLSIILNGSPARWISINLFLLLTPGFICMAYAVWCGQQVLQHRQRPRSVWIAPTLFIGAANLLLALVVGLPNGPSMLTMLLISTTIPSVTLGGLCIRQAYWLRAPLVKEFCGGYIAIVILLNILPALGAPMAQALARILNMAAALLLVIIARLLDTTTRRRMQLRARLAQLAS